MRNKPKGDRAPGLPPTLRAELARRNAAHDTEYWILLSAAEAVDLASGYVPATIRAQCLHALDELEQDRRRAVANVAHARR